MQSGSAKKETQQNLSQSRILFEQVVVDNQPTEEQVIQRAEELQIDDFVLARQSLTKQLEAYWRPYMNRYQDIYYVNLKERKAYVDHPIDMQTKILYAKRHKKPLPKFKSYPLDEVAQSVDLIEEEIRKWQRGELAYTQSIPSQLNIVYEQSQQSQTQRENSHQSYQDQSSPSSQQEEYIENLQKTQRQNQRNIKASPKQQKQALDKRHKKFPTLHDSQSQDDFQLDEEEHLSPQLQKLLLEYEQLLRKQNEKQIHTYRAQKQENYLKKQELFRQRLKSKQDAHKFNVSQEYQTEIEEKNSLNFHKETHKIKLESIEKLQRFETSLEKEKQAIEKLQSLHQEKQHFIHSLEERLQRRLLHGKCMKSQEIQRELHGTYYLSAIKELSNKDKELFQKDCSKVIQQKANQILSHRGIMNQNTNEKSYPLSLAAMYESLVRKELQNIDRLLVENEISRDTRRRSRSIFGKQRRAGVQQEQRHIKFAKQIQTSKLIRAQAKQNDQNIANTFRQGQITQIIQQEILKSSQNNLKYQQRRNKIFGNDRTDIEQKGAFSKEPQIQRLPGVNKQLGIKKQVWQKTPNYAYSQTAKLDRRSLCLRMMKRIL